MRRFFTLRALVLLAAAALLVGGALYLLLPEQHVHAPTDDPSLPNRVDISPKLVTSGQPSARALSELKANGFEAVIYLAPPSVPDAVPDEHQIVARQGMVYVNIPIRFDDPTEADFRKFTAVLDALSDRKVLVHCQINMRASVMTFLHRTIVRKEPPGPAYDAVTKIWSPDGPWRKLIESQLRKHAIAFEPF